MSVRIKVIDMSINDKTYLAQIEGETPADRKKRLNRLAQQRYREKQRTLNKEAFTAKQTNYKRISRAKITNTVPKTIEEEPVISRLPNQTVEKFNKSLDKLQSYIKTATVRDLPKIKAVVGNLPDEIEYVKANKNCDDLTKLIQDRENALTEQDPNRKKIPTDKTITQTVQGVKNIYKKYSGGKDLDCADLDWVRDTDKVLDFIDKHKKWPKLSTKNQQVIKLASFLRNLEGYQKEYKIYSRQSSYVQNTVLKEMIGKNTLSDAQKAKYMDWTTLIDKLEKAWPDTTFEARALTAVYTLFAPRRTQDYSLMKVIRKKKVNESAIEKLNKDYNYLILDKKNWPVQFIFNKYKTQKYFNQQIFNLTKKENGELMSILSAYIKDDDIHNNEFLFRKVGSLKPYTASEFSDLTGSYFQELVGKRMGSTLLRHSFITDALSDKNMTDGEKALLAYQMSHSVSIQSTYRVIDKEGQDDVLNFTGTIDKDEQEGLNKKIKELVDRKTANNKKKKK